jgi:sigma-B regulation protein RsbU (phosphoserine phosphatase)
VARFRDWLELGRNTIDSLKTSDVTNLYSNEWPETKKALIADHREVIDGEPKRFRRFVRTTSAMMFGLAKRLAPHRRVLFVLSWLAFFVCLTSIFGQMRNPPLWTFIEVVATFLMLTLLLSMELIDKIKYRDELELARDLQADLIPREPPQTPDFEIAAYNEIANTVGGDIYDFVPLPDGRVAILFGDASGHGMAAGLVMAVAHAAFRTQIDVDPSPAAVIASLNRILCRTGGPRSFFSCCYVLLSPSGEFTATTAGHPPLLKIGTDGKIASRIGSGSYPLGIKSNLGWREHRDAIASGDRLLLHSDGLTEARNAHGREFGDSFVEAIAGWNPKASADSLVRTYVDELKLFTGGRAPEDDVSIAVISRR